MFFLYQVGSSIFSNLKGACCTQEGVTPEQILAKLRQISGMMALGRYATCCNPAIRGHSLAAISPFEPQTGSQARNKL